MLTLTANVKKIWKYFLVVLMVGIYWMLVDNYVNRNICQSRGSFLYITLLFVCLSLALCRYRQGKELGAYPVLLKYGNIFLFILLPFYAFYIVELIYNPSYTAISIGKIIINYLLFMAIQLGIYLISPNFKIAYIFVLLFAWVYGIANYYVLLFKGNPLLPSDLMSYKTAMTVASNYTFDLSDTIVNGTLLLMMTITVVLYMPLKKKKYIFKQKSFMLALGVLQLSLCFILGTKIKWADILNINTNTMELENTYYENGGLFAFLLECQAMMVEKPQGYSAATEATILNQYSTDSDISNNEVVPSVIVIMNEALSDLSVLGELESDEYLTTLNNMPYVMKGSVYTSIVGGGTCNSEFEFLTGNTLANFSGSVYPYQMYNFETIDNLASAFSHQGYDTVAIHPCSANNWSREKVYQGMGFQDFISIEDMSDVEYVRAYASDSYNFKQIIDTYENREHPIFIFNVTLQNHGGYTSALNEFDLINVEDKYQKYKDVMTYLTLVRESDRAFGDLLSYFSTVSEPVIVCMFGDHQPVLDEEFIAELLDCEIEELSEQPQRFITPYVIWSNYDSKITNVSKDMSVNYLGANVLELAGISTPYSNFLLDMQENIPIINKFSYQTSNGEWHSIDTPNDFVNQYRNMQYYMLFDNK